MEREIENIRRELAYIDISRQIDEEEEDWKSATRAFWWSFGLKRALDILEGGKPLVDDEILAGWKKSKIKRGVVKYLLVHSLWLWRNGG